jgi:hypothetical protein
MRKFSKIFESKEELLSRLSTSDDNLEEIFVDLTDIGYTIITEQIYISTSSGNIYYDKKEVKNFYPGIEIRLDRHIDDKKGDFRNWDGNIYYENDDSILEHIYNSLHRVKSSFKDKASIYYSIRSINTIEVRLFFDKEEGNSIIDYEKVEELVDKLQIEPRRNDRDRYRDLDGERIEGYSIFKFGGQIYEFVVKLREVGDNINIIGNDLTPGEWSILSDITRWENLKNVRAENDLSNKTTLMSIFNIWCTKFYKYIKSENIKLIPVNGGRKENGYKITHEVDGIAKDLITIYYWFDERGTYDIYTEEKSWKNYMKGKIEK